MALSTHIKKAPNLGESGRGAGGCLINEERLGVRGGACAARRQHRPGPGRLHLPAVVLGWKAAGRSGRPSINVDFRADLKGAWCLLKQKKEKAVGRGWEGEEAPISPSPCLPLCLPPSLPLPPCLSLSLHLSLCLSPCPSCPVLSLSPSLHPCLSFPVPLSVPPPSPRFPLPLCLPLSLSLFP